MHFFLFIMRHTACSIKVFFFCRHHCCRVSLRPSSFSSSVAIANIRKPSPSSTAQKGLLPSPNTPFGLKAQAKKESWEKRLTKKSSGQTPPHDIFTTAWSSFPNFFLSTQDENFEFISPLRSIIGEIGLISGKSNRRRKSKSDAGLRFIELPSLPPFSPISPLPPLCFYCWQDRGKGERRMVHFPPFLLRIERSKT